jgi:hypothetical protein
MTIFLELMPFNVACDLATTSMFRIRLLARFSLNVICKMAESIGFPEICRPSLLSFLCEILKFAVEYLCCAKLRYYVPMTERENDFICVHDHSVLATPPMASSPFVASFHLPRRRYQRRFQLWSVSPYRFHDSTAPVANPDSQHHETTRMDSCQMMHYHQNTVVSEHPKVERLSGLLTVYVIQTTADAMSKYGVARR